MVGDMDDTDGSRDIIIDSHIKGLERISYIHLKLMALHYPILFPHGCDGFHKKIPFGKVDDKSGKKREFISMKEYYSYKFQVRTDEAITPRLGGRLYQQLKLDQFIEDIKKKNYFGTCLGVMYVVEFQKRGLPHVHMLIWLDSVSKHIFPKSTVQPQLLIRNPHLILNEKQQQYYALAEIHTLLKSIGKSLKDYTQMFQPPNSYLDCSVNNLIIEETSYDTAEMEKEYATLIFSCNTEQMEIYNAVMKSVEKKEVFMQMSFYHYDNIQDLDDSTDEWNLRVRTQAIWKGITRQTCEFRGYNIIFFDDYSSRIHAFITAPIVEQFEHKLKEGQIYKIQNFQVKNYKQQN
ncbi:hypothetical protein POM88_004196 [Heracleum sosnowskyi]|uniref:Helitron helicase-like domain-containing protein n=1 Tax=Heracleum sosnowskyi TaxID=360622 RepID=A0AAD8JL16_9APIA|nr:hypothetical protein POM88_004196 [Heracleum sosnowskyi]